MLTLEDFFSPSVKLGFKFQLLLRTEEFLIYLRTYLLTYLFIPWSRVLPEKLPGFQLVKKFPSLYGTWRFITAFPTAQPRLSFWMIHNMICFYGEELLAPRPAPNLEDHPLSSVCDCLFNIFAATLHIGGRSSIHNLRTCHALVTGTHLSWEVRGGTNWNDLWGALTQYSAQRLALKG